VHEPLERFSVNQFAGTWDTTVSALQIAIIIGVDTQPFEGASGESLHELEVFNTQATIWHWAFVLGNLIVHGELLLGYLFGLLWRMK
jgi:hypothetical protein